jgi:Holliday junction resolvasome RuvABC endonuclease subunit
MNTILALDIATITGWAMGPASDNPQYGTVRLKARDDHPREAAYNLMCFLADIFRAEVPDFVVWEEPMPPIFHANQAAKTGKVQQNNASMTLPVMLDGVIYACCTRKGVPCAAVNRMKVLNHFTGKARWGGGAEAKRAVVSRCHMLGLLPKNVKNDDIADAISIWHWAAATRYRAIDKKIVLFDQGRMKSGATG